MNNTQNAKTETPAIWTRIGFWALISISLPFIIGAVMIGLKFIQAPDTAGSIAKGQLLKALLFTFGFSMGMVGAAVALFSTSASRRLLGTATTLFGCANIVLGLAVMRVVEDHITGSSIAPAVHFIIPTVLWAYSVLLAIKAPGIADLQDASPQIEIKEEQPQLQSQP